jgi:hypothetical protein
MTTISNIATAPRNSVFGESAATTKSGAEPPAGDAPGKGTPEAPYDPGNVPEQAPTQPGTEPPSGGPPGKGTAEAPFDPGNEPEQTQVTGSSSGMADATEPPPSSSIPASKIDNPDPSVPSDMETALASNDAANTANQATATASSPTASDPDQNKLKKEGTAKPGSHSALFGLGPKEDRKEGSGGATTTSSSAGIHPPKESGELSGTIDEVAEVMGEQVEMEKKGASEDDTGGYVGLKKAAMEEEEKKRNGSGDPEGKSAPPPAAAAASKEEQEERDSSTSIFTFQLV